MSYSNGIMTTHVSAASDFIGAAVEDSVVEHGPKGLTGRVKSITGRVTTGITVAASTYQVGVPGGDLDAYASAVMPIAAIGEIIGGTDLGGEITDGVLGNVIPADTLFSIGNSGGSTAGVATVTIVIEWS